MSSSDRFGTYRLLAACLPLFLLLATLNSAGYRYGASDQAFYVPAILERADPDRFPRDSALITSQAKLTIIDEVVGPFVRLTGLRLPVVFVALQVVTLSLLVLALLQLASLLYRTHWAAYALVAAMTLRHAVPQSGTNTLEGYFHPRQMAFALGALSIVRFLRADYAWMCALVTIAFVIHPTTALWFAIWLGVSIFAAEPRLRRGIAIAAALVGIVSVWALVAGPLAGRVVRMDAEWLATLGSRVYLFPFSWPPGAWLVNLAYIPLVVWLHQRRRRAGLALPREGALVIGVMALVAIFAISLPFNLARVAIAIQLQPARVFWMLDFLAVVYVVWALAEGIVLSYRRAQVAATVLLCVSIARGAYIKLVEFPERRIAQVALSNDDWGQSMAWARSTPVDSGWLADPAHAVIYGTSLRVAAERDVFVEAVKDGAVGMYDRGVAMRTRDRVRIVGDFPTLSPERARAIAQEYDLDYLITEQKLELPLEFRSGILSIYRLR
jgi:hypothetical protein